MAVFEEIFQKIKKDNNIINTAIYVDYENVLKRLKEYDVHPINDMDFFRTIGNELKQSGFNIVKYTAFANFDDYDFKPGDQTYIQSFGVETKHTANDGKTSSDMDLIVNTLHDLYKNTNIQLFVIISSDRDYISLLKEIKLENKLTLVLSTKNGFNQVVKTFANFHQFIEDIFDFETRGCVLNLPKVQFEELGYKEEITEELRDNATKVSNYLFDSDLWKKYMEVGIPVGLNGYANIVVKNLMKDKIKKDIVKYFHIAHQLGIVCLYRNEKDNQLYFENPIDNSEKM